MNDSDLALTIILLLLFASLLGATSGKTHEPTRLNPIRTPENVTMEPNNLTIIFQDNMATTQNVAEQLTGWPSHNLHSPETISFASVAGTRALKITKAGVGTDRETETIVYRTENEYWVQLKIRFPSTFHLTSPTNKWFSLGDCVFEYVDASNTLYAEYGIWDDNLQFNFGVGIVNGGVYSDLVSHSGQVYFNRDQWYTIKYHVVRSTSNGAIQLWINDQLIVDWTVRTKHSITAFNWIPCKHYCETDEQENTVYFDDIIFATTEADLGGTVTPPDPPIEPPAPTYYYVNVSSAGNGQVTPSGSFTVPVGQNFSMVATPNTDYTFGYWTRNGTTRTSNPYTITDGHADLTYNMIAYFTYTPPVEPDPPTPPVTGYFSINIGTSTGGTTDLTGNQTYLFGETAIINVETIKDNYRFNYWLLDNVNWGSNRQFTLTGTVNTSYTLLPVFQYVPPPLPNEPFLPPSQNVGVLSRGIVSQYFGKTKQQKPIQIEDLLKQLSRLKI